MIHFDHSKKSISLLEMADTLINNGAAVNIYYTKEVNTQGSYQKYITTCNFGKETNCEYTNKISKQVIQDPKIINFEIFKMVTKSLCRRQNIYVLNNYNRSILLQTGEGHFSPLAGYCQQNNKGSF